MTPTLSRSASITLTLVSTVVLGLTLAACTATPTATETTAAVAGSPAEQPVDRGVSGEIAAVQGTTLQVQDTDSQTAVTFTDATTVEVEVAGTLADVTAGSCVVVSGDGETASTVAITQPVDGECTTGFGGGFPDGEAPAGDVPEGTPTGRPADGEMPEGMPTGMPADGGMGGFGGSFTTGLVTAVDATGFTVAATGQDGTTTDTVLLIDDATTYTTTVAGDSTALVVGLCLTAQGEADESGGFAATSITVSEPGDNGCTTGFARMGGRGPAGTGTEEDSQ